MVLSGTLANQMESRKRSVWLSGWNPKAKSPESDNHGVLLSVAVRELPMVTFPFWAIEKLVTELVRKEGEAEQNPWVLRVKWVQSTRIHGPDGFNLTAYYDRERKMLY